MSTLADILDGHPADSDAVLVPGGPRAGYGDLKDEVERVAELLAGAGRGAWARGVRSAGERVGLPDNVPGCNARRRDSRASELGIHGGRVPLLHGGRGGATCNTAPRRPRGARSGRGAGHTDARRIARRRRQDAVVARRQDAAVARRQDAHAARGRRRTVSGRRGTVPAHLRHNEQAKGRAAYAHKLGDVARQHRRHVRADAGRRGARGDAAVPRSWADRRRALDATYGRQHRRA